MDRPTEGDAGGERREAEAEPRPGSLTGFRGLLAIGALVTAVLGIWGLFFSGALHAALGPRVDATADGFVGVSRLLGALSLGVAVGYAVASLHPRRHRGVLVVGFTVPLLLALAAVIAAAKDEIAPGRGAVFAALNLAYVLLYFRLYPKPEAAREAARPGRGDAGAEDGAGEGSAQDDDPSSDNR